MKALKWIGIQVLYSGVLWSHLARVTHLHHRWHLTNGTCVKYFAHFTRDNLTFSSNAQLHMFTGVDRCSCTNLLLSWSWIRSSPGSVQLQQTAQQLLRVSECVLLKQFLSDTCDSQYPLLLKLRASD